MTTKLNHRDCHNYAPNDVVKGMCHVNKTIVLGDDPFAGASISRDDLRLGAEELGLPLDTHVANVITFLREQADALGLRGTL